MAASDVVLPSGQAPLFGVLCIPELVTDGGVFDSKVSVTVWDPALSNSLKSA